MFQQTVKTTEMNKKASNSNENYFNNKTSNIKNDHNFS
jgi:hypothetical protein